MESTNDSNSPEVLVTKNGAENGDVADESQELPTIELFVKASSVVPSKIGEDPISQKWFMAFVTLVENKLINLRVTPLDLKNPSADYVELNVGKRFPVAVVRSGRDPISGEDLTGSIADADDSIEVLMTRFRCPGLEIGASAFKITEDLFRNFNIFLQTGSDTKLLKDLTALNIFLDQRGTVYLQGDSLSYVDCVVMPKLQHIRVACAEIKNFEIPFGLTAVWAYVAAMYRSSAFRYSCPSDRDIVIHYLEKLRINPKEKQRRLTLRGEAKTDSIPPEVKLPGVEQGFNESGDSSAY